MKPGVNFVVPKFLRSACALNAMLILLTSFAMNVHADAPLAESQVRPDQVVDTLESTFGSHPGLRKNHAKGTCAAGQFVGDTEAAKYSRSPLFTGQTIPVVARFSLAGGNPDVADNTRNARGMALEFRFADGSRQHITMLNTPVFGAAQPKTFNDLIAAAKPDPKTGKPDPEKMKAFFASHADALGQADFFASHNPPTEYFNETFYSIHTFKFLDTKGAQHLVKWRFTPHDGEKRLTDAQLKAASHDFLEHDLIERVGKGTAQWDMVVYLGQPGDAEDNPTIAWPENRKHFVAGTLTINKASPQAGGECEKVNFDPLVMADGIAPTNDPILLFRSPAYAVSFGRRLSGK